MSVTVNVHEAKTHLSRLLERVLQGEEIIIARAGTPVARLTALPPTTAGRKPGTAIGKVTYSDDFAEPLPDEVISEFEK